MRAFKVFIGILMIVWGGAFIVAPLTVAREVVVAMVHGKVVVGIVALLVLATNVYGGTLLMRAGFQYPSR